ncbi:type II toxin-antitoxin system VapC family toxin [Agrobacterium vitis]|uniref:PIN domain-containing protein n=1 Tax=Agrobacterium vitis TaxID=373 RepID=A0AAE4W9S5_AGRVI|nr:type II toxin-antitoxin system VapC family toxin [Agrobacterium vitis]MCF1497784.1 type II toxin-antitoxin system VapC family toxin [Allorhizobium sp. Av2]MBF2715046.1 type II toxin-antitoxin system VapC family toxin [Agrobacterium vitis]MCM2441326.1 type II toxin-antitoxin system VapC family toxin [Agrobacterium vitis]MUZ55924.1 PIN domain-containing protein [Agrobacterium vitis]MUZ65475.1 PIN domain-containing protein [Agrobacterium vitis]
MIGIDTNILLRLTMQDDDIQTKQALALADSLTQDQPGFVNSAVLLEFIWTARRKVKMSKEELRIILSGFLDSENLVLEDENLIELTLDEMDRSSEEFADIFIALKNREFGCRTTMTFDRKAARTVPHMELLA